MSGISGGEFGVRGYLTAYNVALDGKLCTWRATRWDGLRHPDGSAEDTHLGKPVGKDSGHRDLEGDQWQIGGGPLGLYSYDPSSHLIYYGSGNPST